MKKTMMLVIAVAALGFTACKKDRTCTCNVTSTTETTTTPSGGSPTTTTDTDTDVDVTIISKARKSVARPNCLSYKEEESNTYDLGGAVVVSKRTTEGSCTLK